MTFQRVFTGSAWEKQIGYCRALRAGDLIFVTGCAPVDASGTKTFAPGDPYAQARRCLERIEAAIGELGASRAHIVRTRMFVTDATLWPAFGRAHAEFFADAVPTTTMVQIVRLIEPDMLIEIEADAVAPAR